MAGFHAAMQTPSNGMNVVSIPSFGYCLAIGCVNWRSGFPSSGLQPFINTLIICSPLCMAKGHHLQVGNEPLKYQPTASFGTASSSLLSLRISLSAVPQEVIGDD